MSDWKDWLTVDTLSQNTGRVIFRNGKVIGYITKDVDGYWKYSFDGAGYGLWTDANLHMIADMLVELNMEWDDEVRKHFENE